MAQDPDAPRLCGMSLATPTPCEEFGPLVCRKHAMHVQQQLIFRRVP
jgi:hypothetical protein